MTTYVLGAGASLHAGYPLANQLGEAIKSWLDRQNNPILADYRVETEYVNELYGGFGNFEDVLTDLDDPKTGSPSEALAPGVRSRLLNQFLISTRSFFADLAIGKAGLYERLARERVQAGDTIITFNYDVEIERELKRAGLWEVTDGYGFPVDLPQFPATKVPVLKLHGSANWLGLIFAAGPGLGRRPVIFGTRDFDYLGYSNAVNDTECPGGTRSGGIPAMIMPTHHKRFYMKSNLGREWEGFWENLWVQAGRALERSDEVAIIGYSMAPADERACALLLEKTNPEARVTLCCRGRSAAMANGFASHGFGNVQIIGDGSFESFLTIDSRRQ